MAGFDGIMAGLGIRLGECLTGPSPATALVLLTIFALPLPAWA